MNLYISDLHFGHANVIRFDNRPFKSADEMDRTMIQLWNYRVQHDDTVYIVGDLCYRNENPAQWYLRQLKGKKYLILGNHDEQILKNQAALAYFEGVDRMMEIQDGDRHITLCHYPLTEWRKYYSGSWHIYGHIHNTKKEAYEIMCKKDHALNAGCMINNFAPASFNELLRNNEAFKKDGSGAERDPDMDLDSL